MSIIGRRVRPILSYVYRYAGMLEHSTRECETALALDPGDMQFRSCAWAFMELGNTKRAADFAHLNAGSEWATYILPYILLREGKIPEAKQAVLNMPTPPRYHRQVLEACLDLRLASDLERAAYQAETDQVAEPDPEALYQQGTILGYCGKRTAAFHLLQRAIKQNYCAYSALQNDPLLANLRGSSEFKNLVSAAKECQDRLPLRSAL